MCSISHVPELTSHPVDVGLRSEAAVLAELVKRGYNVLVPWGVNQRYDLVIDCKDDFLRVQCKTGRLRGGAIQFRATSTQSNTCKTRQHGYVGEVDLFAVFCPDNGRVYLVPSEDVPKTGMFLRVDAPRNRQSKRVRWASEYELPA